MSHRGLCVTLACRLVCMRVHAEPPPPKEKRQELATVEIFEGLFKFSGIVTSEQRAWLSVATTLL